MTQDLKSYLDSFIHYRDDSLEQHFYEAWGSFDIPYEEKSPTQKEDVFKIVYKYSNAFVLKFLPYLKKDLDELYDVVTDITILTIETLSRKNGPRDKHGQLYKSLGSFIYFIAFKYCFDTKKIEDERRRKTVLVEDIKPGWTGRSLHELDS